MPPAFQSDGGGSAGVAGQPTTAYREPKASRQSRRTQVISYDIERRTCFHRPFIRLHFTADIIGPTGAATDTDERTVTALVRDVIKARPACAVSRVAAPGGSSCAMPRRRPFRHAE
jgi:hypothetical protein